MILIKTNRVSPLFQCTACPLTSFVGIGSWEEKGRGGKSNSWVLECCTTSLKVEFLMNKLDIIKIIKGIVYKLVIINASAAISAPLFSAKLVGLDHIWKTLYLTPCCFQTYFWPHSSCTPRFSFLILNAEGDSLCACGRLLLADPWIDFHNHHGHASIREWTSLVLGLVGFVSLGKCLFL